MEINGRELGHEHQFGGSVADGSLSFNSLVSPVHVCHVTGDDTDSVEGVFDQSTTAVEFEIELVTNSNAALDLLEREPVDCVLSRYELPDTTGIELLEQVRERSCDLPFVLLARDGSEQIASDAIATGVTDYVPLDGDGSVERLPGRLAGILEEERKCITTDQLDGIEAAVEYAADAVIVTDTDGTIEYVNPAFEEVTGYSREEAVGRNPRILKSGAQEQVYYEEMWNAILDGRVWEEEILNETKSGDRYVAHQTVAPVTDCDGSIQKFVGIQRDVTTQRRLEAQIDREATTLSRVYDITSDTEMTLQEKIEAMLDIGSRHLDLPIGYVTRIEDGTQHVIAASGDHDSIQAGAEDPLEQTYCRRTITRSEPLVVDDALERGWQDDPAFERFGLQCYLGARICIDGETYGTLCFGGEDARDELILSALQSTVQTLANWLGYEIERHRNERELERTNERLDEFASIVSHDLRNPLNVATIQLDIAREATEPTDHLQEVATAHERMSSIIEETLTLAREGHVVEERATVTVPELIENCWETVETRNATLDVRDQVRVDGDSDQMRHIFENLIRNAIEHAGPDVSLTLGATESGFYVADDGPGIDQSRRDDVFDSGFSTSRTGTGFGLAIVQRIAEAHGWAVTVTESESGGARFEFDTTDGYDRSADSLLLPESR
jgi:PAS domain S-box-containing protein